METMNFGEEQNNSAPKAPNNRKKKLIWAGVVLAVLILSVIGWQYWQYTHSAYYQQMKGIRNFDKLLTEDRTGGKTPEETLDLFRNAVNKGDFELASKYAYFNGGQQDVKAKLEKIKGEGNINLLIDDLKNAKIVDGLTKDYKDVVVYYNGKWVSIFTLNLNEKNSVWKIVEF